MSKPKLPPEHDSAAQPLTNEAKTSNRNIEHKQRVDSDSNSVLQHTRAPKDTDSCCQGPRDQNQIYGYSWDSRETHGTEKGSDNQRKERVSDNTDRLEERTVVRTPLAAHPSHVQKSQIGTYILPPSNLICNVTTASPIHTIVNTPEKTSDDCSPLARIDRNILRSKQKISGPLARQSVNESPHNT